MSASARPGVAVLGGGGMNSEDYSAFLGKEYLAHYLPGGGGSVKIVVTGDGQVADGFERSLRHEADQHDVQMVSLSAETTKAHMIDQVFFAVARQIDWDQVAVGILSSAYENIAMPATPGRLTVAEVADDHDLDRGELYRSVRRQLEHILLADTSLPRELRRALLRLAQAHLGGRDMNRDETQCVLGWLTGERVGLRELREVMIYARTGRHNARGMLTSVGRLLQRGGHSGLVLHIDLTRLAEMRRPPLPERTGIYYSKAAVLDVYELLRQLIDATDDLVGMLVVAVVPPELVSDEKRGLASYAALHLRVADEVRDRRRTNPFATLVRLDVRLEAVR